MHNVSVAHFHKFIIFISRYIFSNLANIIKLVMNGLLCSKALENTRIEIGGYLAFYYI